MFTVPIKSSWWDLVYAYAPWVLLAIAAGVVLWALFPTGRGDGVRCPRCWYDMNGIPGSDAPNAVRKPAGNALWQRLAANGVG